MYLKFGDLLKAHYENGYWVTADGTYWIVLNDESVGKTGMIGVIGYDCKERPKQVQLDIMLKVVDVVRSHVHEFKELDVADRQRRLRNIINSKRMNQDMYLEFYEVNKKQFDLYQTLHASNKDGSKRLMKLGD